MIENVVIPYIKNNIITQKKSLKEAILEENRRLNVTDIMLGSIEISGNNIIDKRLLSFCYGEDVLFKNTIKADIKKEVINKLKTFSKIIFTSKNAVFAYFYYMSMAGIKKGELAEIINSHIMVYAIGSATRDILTEYGINTDYVPKYYDAESLIERLNNEISLTVETDSNKNRVKEKILFPRAKMVSADIKEALKKYYIVEELIVYENKEVQVNKISLPKKNTAIIFTSASLVKRFFKYYQAGDIENFCLISIGKKTSSEIRKYLKSEIYEAKLPDYGEIVKLIIEINKNGKSQII